MYEAEISRNHPSAFLFLVDQSGSMSDVNENGCSLADEVADCINRFLYDLVIKCTKSEGVHNYFEVGVIGYGQQGSYNGFSGALAGSIVHSIEEVSNNPLRIEQRKKKVSDGAGGVLEQNIKVPVWFEAVANGGTPMCQALAQAANELASWATNHQDSFPPILINITDGEPTDGDPEAIAEQLKSIITNDGNVLIFNVHINKFSNVKYLFTGDESALPNANAKRLFRMSSELTDAMKKAGINEGFNITETSRGYAYNADMVALIRFLDIGTRAGNLR